MKTTISASDLQRAHAESVEPGAFVPSRHYYERALNAQIHSMVAFFLRMTNDQVVERYCHLNPRVARHELTALLSSVPKHFRWAGADLLHATTAEGQRSMVVLETNSCPSGNKSMPLLDEGNDQGGYRRLIATAFWPLLQRRGLPTGGLAVIYDKNRAEASGYAAALADESGETVWLTPFPTQREDAPARFVDGLLEVRTADDTWQPVRAAFRYVTQKPWNRIPVATRTLIFNPVIACLAGGRNKLAASKAYEALNVELHPHGLGIRTPKTIHDVSHAEVPDWVERFGGQAVVKVPYSNAGQGVYTIVNADELARFMEAQHSYDRYIVQSLIGNYRWSSTSANGRLYHVGTVPNRNNEIFAADLRVMVCAGSDGFRPLAIYARRARTPISDDVPSGTSSWDMLGTNLSEAKADGAFDADTDRLMLMDRRDFNTLGIGLDDLVEAYIQAVLSTIAIDRMCQQLITSKGELRRRLFRSLNDDAALMAEVLPLSDVQVVDDLVLDSLAEGRTHKLALHIVDDAASCPVLVPIIVVRGKQPGPVVGITAAVHGNELNGIPTIHNLMSTIDAAELQGTLVAVTIANVPAYHANTRTFPDGADLNRIMPGKAHGSVSQVYANRLLTRIVARFQIMIDLHTASFGRVNSLYVRADMNDPTCAKLARLMGPEIIVHNAGGDGTLRAAAADLGVKSITVEIGDPQTFHSEHIRSSRIGIRDALEDFGMLAPDHERTDNTPVECSRSFWIYTDRGGLLTVLPDVCEQVSAGQTIATLVDPWGEVVASYVAPMDGIVVGKSTNPVSASGARIVHLGVWDAVSSESA